MPGLPRRGKCDGRRVDRLVNSPIMQSNFITMLEHNFLLRVTVSSLRKMKINGGDSVTTSVHAMNVHGT